MAAGPALKSTYITAGAEAFAFSFQKYAINVRIFCAAVVKWVQRLDHSERQRIQRSWSIEPDKACTAILGKNDIVPDLVHVSSNDAG